MSDEESRWKWNKFVEIGNAIHKMRGQVRILQAKTALVWANDLVENLSGDTVEHVQMYVISTMFAHIQIDSRKDHSRQETHESFIPTKVKREKMEPIKPRRYWPENRDKKPPVLRIKEAAKIDLPPVLFKENGKYEEIPHLLDGFRMLNCAPADDPSLVYHLDIAGKNLYYIQEDDLALFTNLTSINAAENNLPFAKFGVLPKLAKLEFSCNGVADLDLEIEGRFENLESLDLSYNYVRDSALIVLAHLRLKTLDLSSNNLCKFPKTVLNMNHWQDDLIEHLMPIQVAALDAMKAPKNDEKPKPRIVQSARDFGKTYMDKLSQRPFTTNKNKEYKNKDYINFKGFDATNIGFSVLSHLILDKNNFGADIDGLFFILGKLQQYLLLSLRKNNIQSMKCLYPEDAKISASFSFRGPALLPKSIHFKTLTELNISENKVDSLFDLMGIACLGSLKRLMVQGNPIMKQFKPLHQLSRRGQEASKRGEYYDLFGLLMERYNISIFDSCYNRSKVHSTENFVRLLPIEKGGGMTKEQLYVKRKFKLPSKANKLRRRNVKLTDQQVNDIIKSGIIPKLESYFSTENAELSKEAELCSIPDGIHYASNPPDNTFVTSVNLIRNPNEAEVVESTSESEIEERELPSTIQASLKALEFALNHPKSYMRILETSYLKPTCSSYSKKIIDHHQRLWDYEIEQLDRFDEMSNCCKTPENSTWSRNGQPSSEVILPFKFGATEGKIEYKATKSSFQEPNLQKQTKKNGPTKTAEVKSKKLSLKQRKDEFEDLSEIMAIIENKLQDVENSLTMKRSQTLINSTKIFKRLQNEYERLENVYINDLLS